MKLKDLNYLNSHSNIHFDPDIMLGLANTPKNQDFFAVSRFPIHNSTYFLFSSTFNPFLLPRRPLFLLFTQFSLNLMHLFLPSFSPLCFLSIIPQDFPIFAPFSLSSSPPAQPQNHIISAFHMSLKIFLDFYIVIFFLSTFRPTFHFVQIVFAIFTSFS